ncbi:MAG: DUF4838 domain-containing protein [Bacteroidota bacterium]
MKTRICLAPLILLALQCPAQSLELANNGRSAYHIYISSTPSAIDIKAANVLQDYFYRVTGVRLPVERGRQSKPAFLIGSAGKEKHDLSEDGFIIRTDQKNIIIAGKNRGTLYAVYDFIDKYLGCKKWDGHTAFTPVTTLLTIPSFIVVKEEPVLQYREVYLPPSFDNEYLDWHKLHRFETEWGLWGHSFFKLVSPAAYYKTHPEYFSLVNGKREPLQLCLSNAAVIKIAVDQLQKLMSENPTAKYWSVSPNDDIGNCECDNCNRFDITDGGPQGSLIHFVNAVASHFPTKMITTLAYGYSSRATTVTKPAGNVVIMLSNIDAYKTKPIETEPSAAPFRNNLAQWEGKTPNVFVWDYCTQFTNYLTPFPITNNFAPNIRYLLQHGVKGIFEQGSANTYSDMPELKSYVCAKLLWNPDSNADKLQQEFLEAYYGKAAPVIAEYLSLLQKNISVNNTSLDIYGNPVNDHAGYLSPQSMDVYSQLMDKAEQLVENDQPSLTHVRAIRLSQEFVYLQQSKFFGKDPHGLFQKTASGEFTICAGLPKRIERFFAACKEFGVKELSEGGISPENYDTEWRSILNTGPKNNLAANASVKLTYPFASEYPSKRERTLVDETPGYGDFSYNWLCFYDVPLEATVDMMSLKKVNTITLNFLEDARHWIFRPSAIGIEVSADGLQYHALETVTQQMPEEDYSANFLPFRFTINENIRYIRVKAANWPRLPAWRYHKYKKPMIACDEIWVE